MKIRRIKKHDIASIESLEIVNMSNYRKSL